MASDIVKSIGHHGLWGFSSTFDMMEALVGSGVVPNGDAELDESPIRILLAHPGDIRHILTTISRRRRHCTSTGSMSQKRMRPVHFYMFETPVEVLGRNILQLELLQDYEVPIRQRANVFLEVYGNSQVQVRTGRYLEQMSHQLRELFTTGKGRLERILDCSTLRYKERDELEEVFRNYSRKTIFDVESLREHRCRGLYAERYDARKAVSDWDYHYTLKATASIIHIKLFQTFRLQGLAFEFGDQEYTEPNRTMMTFTEGVMKKGKTKGELKNIKGFWGDIVISPFIGFGIDCYTPGDKERGLFEIQNKGTGTEQHRHHTAEISVYNLLSSLWEIETGEVYRMSRENDIYSGLGSEGHMKPLLVPKKKEIGVVGDQKVDLTEMDKKIEELDSDGITKALEPVEEGKEGEVENEGEGEGWVPDVPEPESENDPVSTVPELPSIADEDEMAQVIKRAECILDSFDGVKVFPVTGSADAVFDRPKFNAMFDLIYVSSRSVSILEKPYMSTILKPSALICAESSKFLLPLTREARLEYINNVQGFATSQGWSAIKPPVPMRYRDELDTIDDKLFFKR